MTDFKFDGTDDHLDSRDIEEKIVEIEDAYGLDYELFQGPGDFGRHIAENGSAEEADLYERLYSFRDEVQNGADEGWEYGVILTRDDYADGEWAKGRAMDFGAFQGYIPGSPSFENQEEAAGRWPFNHIDWDAAADELKEEANEFDFEGTTYSEL